MKEFWFFLVVVAIIGLLASIFLDRIINPWQRRRSSVKFSKDFRDGKIKPRHFDISIVWDSECVCVQQDKTGEKSPPLAWKDIIKATSFKRDMFSTDRICLFLVSGDDKGLEVHEDMNRWMKLVDELPNFLPGCKSSDWLLSIAALAFETNATEIFVRFPKSTSPGGSHC